MTIVGAAGNFNTFQQRLYAMSNQINAFIIPQKQELIEGVMQYECSPESIFDFFEAVAKAMSDEAF